jgi:hypothetical protein
VVATAAAASVATFSELSNLAMAMKSRKPNIVVEDELEQSRRDALQNPHRMTKDTGFRVLAPSDGHARDRRME